MKPEIKIVYHPEYSSNYSTASCEVPVRVTGIIESLEDKYTIVKPGPCSEEDILLSHSHELLQKEKKFTSRYEVARLAVGGAILCSELAMDGDIPFGVIRPPGHHASHDDNWGFCFFNNMAIAINRLLKNNRIKRAVILDIDLHFGDGTDNIFSDNDCVDVLNIQSSTPEYFIYETESALDSIVSADIIAISAGFDQYIMDWGANLSTDDYNTIGKIAGSFAINKCDGRIFSIFEGGYYIPDLGKNTLALIDGISESFK